MNEYDTCLPDCVYTWTGKYLCSLITTVFQKNERLFKVMPPYRQSHTLYVVISKKWCKIDTLLTCYYTPLIKSIIWPVNSCHFHLPWMTSKVIASYRTYQCNSTNISATFHMVSTNMARRTVPWRQLSFLYTVHSMSEGMSDQYMNN